RVQVIFQFLSIVPASRRKLGPVCRPSVSKLKNSSLRSVSSWASFRTDRTRPNFLAKVEIEGTTINDAVTVAVWTGFREYLPASLTRQPNVMHRASIASVDL